MQSPAHGASADAGQVSEAVTPGASVAAVLGDRQTASAFDTPGEGQHSPGQTSPAVQRSLEGRSNSRGRHGSTGRSLEAAAAVLAAADAAALGVGPLSAPRLRVQGADIILEDAASPKAPPGGAAAAAGAAGAGGANGRPSFAAEAPARGAAAPAGGKPSSPAAAVPTPAAAANHAVQPSLPSTQQQQAGAPAAPSAQQQSGQLPGPPLHSQSFPQQHHLVAAARATQSHELELQLRLASRTATQASNMAFVGSRPTALINSGSGHIDVDRLRLHDAGGGGGAGGGGAGGEVGPSGSSAAAAVEGPVRMKYRSTLTEENVAYLNKLDQYAARPDVAGRSSSERIWRWLEGSGPPFDNPPPSLGVPSVSKGGTNVAATSRRQAEKRSGGGGGFFASCFGCFGGGGGGGGAKAAAAR